MVFQSKDEQDQAVKIAEAHYDQIYRFCARRLPTVQDAQDATQEVFLRFIKGESSYTNLGKPLAYLYRIARNVVIDFHRRDMPETPVLEMDVADPKSSSGEDALIMSDAISHLDEKEQLVLELRYGEDMAMNQITEILGVSRFSVHRIEKRALAALEQMLGDGRE